MCKAHQCGLLALFLAVTGCAHQDYPTSWPQPLAKLEPDGCSALTGLYEDWPTRGSFDPTGLFDHVTKYGGHLRQMDYVKVDMPAEGTLKFEAYEAGKKVEELVVSEAEETLLCTEWGAEMPMGGIRGAEEVLIISKKSLFLRKDEAGALLLMDDEAGVGFYGVIPFPGNQLSWYRYLPHSPDKK